jgi:hypothetical protein
MTPEQIAVKLIEDNGGSLVPTFNRDIGTAFWSETGQNLNKILYGMSDKKEIVKDFVRWVPEQFSDNGDGTISLTLGGVKVNRRVGKDGRISEAIFYLPAAVPVWVQRRSEHKDKVEDLRGKIKDMVAHDTMGDDPELKKALTE